MTTIAPNKVTLTCTISGKVVIWTNKKIIQAKIDQFGSLEAFVKQFKCKGAVKREPVEPMMKKVMEEGVELGKMSKEEYLSKHVKKETREERAMSFGKRPTVVVKDEPTTYITRQTIDKHGVICTVISPSQGAHQKDVLLTAEQRADCM